jgi:hypothetical protein
MTKTANLAQLASVEAQGDTATPFETSFGYQAGSSNTGQRNSFYGYQAGKTNASGVDNSVFGFQALVTNLNGGYNTAIGSYSMNLNLTGSQNTAVGYYSLLLNSTGNYNSAVGYLSLYGCTSSNNSAFGNLSLYQLQTGANNTAVGSTAGTNLTSGSNNTCLGYNAQPSSSSIDNEITLGNTSVSTLRCATTTITSLSDERDKKNIIDLPAGLAFINAVRPVAFDWNARDESKIDIPDTGFLAQNLQQVQAQLGITIPGLVYDTNPDKLEAGYSKLLPVLVKAIQELSARVEALEAAA